jgi:hypothetical protein
MKQQKFKNLKQSDGVRQNMLDKNDLSSNNSRGISNTPLTDKKTNRFTETQNDKRYVIDWFSYTFSDLEYDKTFNAITNDYDFKISETKKNDFILDSLLKLMNIDKQWENIEIQNYALNGFRFSWLIGEFIKINFVGPKMSDGNYSTQLLFSGKACREFEYNFKGSFFHLIDFLLSKHSELGYTHIDSIIYDSSEENTNGFENTGEISEGKRLNGSFKRIDIAIDDFSGKEQNIYDLKYYAEKHWWIGSYRSYRNIESSIKNNSIGSKGFSLTFGSTGSNQLVIYDKYLEQLHKEGLSNIDHNLWYRYEMRFVNDKAKTVVSQLLAFKKINKLNEYVLRLLNSCIEFKVLDEEVSNPSRQYIRTQPTLESWKKFTEHTKKVDLNNHLPPDLSIKKKLKWIDYSLPTTFIQLYLIHRDDPDIFRKAFLNYANKGALKLKKEQFIAINKYLKRNGKKEISEKEMIEIKNYGIFFKGGKKNEI